jgi:hypothetical protein
MLRELCCNASAATRVWADSIRAFKKGLLLIFGAIEVVDGARLQGAGGAGLTGYYRIALGATRHLATPRLQYNYLQR